MANRLSSAQSAYLRQHAGNPVDWWPWSAKAFAEARRRDVPVFISIGYAACHWCHVMAGESFEDPAVAALLNERFVSIKVDREERPDVDDAYMAATQALTGQGGWPMSIFTTGSGQVFHAGTYFPPQRTGQVPSFVEVCDAVWEAWTQRRSQVEEQAGHISAALGDRRRRQSRLATAVPAGEPEAPDDEDTTLTRKRYEGLSRAALEALREAEDTVHGGFGPAPKFPPTPLLAWLLEEPSGFVLAEPTMTAMARSALFDQVEGGFARYATDRAWALPHFEKMLSDNAQLIGAYAKLSAHPAAQPAVREHAERTARMSIDWLRRRMLTNQGLLASSLDADTVEADGTHTEGGTYLFSDADLTAAALAAGVEPEQAKRLTELNSGVPADEHAAVSGEPVQLTEQTPRTIHFDAPLQGTQRHLWESVLPQLQRVRGERAQPSRDEKVVAAWNAQAIRSLAEAGALWNDQQTLQFAEGLADRLFESHARTTQTPAEETAEGGTAAVRFTRISRTSYAGVAGSNPGTLDDHAHTAYACFALAVAGAHRHHWAERGVAVLRYTLTEFVTQHDGELRVLHALDSDGLLTGAQDGAADASPVDGPEPSSIAALLQALQIAEALGFSAQLPYLAGQGPLTPRQLLHHLPTLAPRAPLAVGASLLAARRDVLGSPAFRVFSANAEELAEIRGSAVLTGIPVEPVDPAAAEADQGLRVSVCLNSPLHAVCLAPSSSVEGALAQMR